MAAGDPLTRVSASSKVLGCVEEAERFVNKLEGDELRGEFAAVLEAAQRHKTGASAAPQPTVERGAGFYTMKSVPFASPKGKYDIEFSEDGFSVFGTSNRAFQVARENLDCVRIVSVESRYQDPHALVVVFLKEGVAWGKGKLESFALQSPAVDKKIASSGPLAVLGASGRVEGVKEENFVRSVDAGKLRKGLQESATEMNMSGAFGESGVIGVGANSAALFALLATSVFGSGAIKSKDATKFRSSRAQRSVKCILGTTEGRLWCLDDAFVFGPRKLTLIPHSKVDGCSLGRGGVGGRTFDLDLSREDAKDISFGHIELEERGPIESYVRGSKFGPSKDDSKDNKEDADATENEEEEEDESSEGESFRTDDESDDETSSSSGEDDEDGNDDGDDDDDQDVEEEEDQDEKDVEEEEYQDVEEEDDQKSPKKDQKASEDDEDDEVSLGSEDTEDEEDEEDEGDYVSDDGFVEHVDPEAEAAQEAQSTRDPPPLPAGTKRSSPSTENDPQPKRTSN